MKTQPPPVSFVASRVDHAEAAVGRRLRRSRIRTRVVIGAAALGVFSLGGVGAATAFFPQYVDMEGVVKSAYVDEFVECVKDAGWDATVLEGATAASILNGFDVDPSAYSAVGHHLPQESLREASNAIGDCQTEVSDRVGESIAPD